ncbi:MAG: MBL fold metallo-hydrolase [Gammaproteobacteria bacterium]
MPVRPDFLLLPTACALLAAGSTLAQPPPRAPLPMPPEGQVHIDTARGIAGDDLKVPFDFFCVPGNARPNDFSAPPLEPVKLFDNLYAVGNSESVVYAIMTSDGIVLLDSGHPGDLDALIFPGLRALGLDPADIKYVLLGHGHNDHYGGAAQLQQQGARIGTTEADWETIAAERPSQLFGDVAKPERDLVLREGEPLVVGDTTITPVEIPGHTPGSLAFIFPVRDGGSEHVAGLFGGTVLAAGFVPLPSLRQYVDSIAHYREIAEDMRVDVEIQNHPIFDDTPARIAALAARAPGSPHPFVMGNERYLRFWDVVSSCMQASLIQREAAQ